MDFAICSGEEFSYDLKNLHRAILIGEITKGGAHLVSSRRLTDHLFATVPFAKAINPVTKTNWEGKGVEPDLAAPASEALKVAHKLALKQLSERETNLELRRSLLDLAAKIE